MRWSLAIAATLIACDSNMTLPDASFVDAGEEDAGLEDALVPPPPRRVLFVVKNSNSMAVADPDRRRRAIVEEAIGEVEGDAQFALIAYSDGLREAGFTGEPTSDARFQSVLASLDTPENLGALDGALRRAREMVEAARAIETDPELRWSLVVATDGFPTPTCTEAPDINPICESPRSDWGLFGFDPDDPTVFYGFEGEGAVYNRRFDAITHAQALAPLATVHSVLLYDEALVGQPIERSLGLDRSECAAFVEDLAEAGGGSVETGDGADIEWNAFLK